MFLQNVCVPECKSQLSSIGVILLSRWITFSIGLICWLDHSDPFILLTDQSVRCLQLANSIDPSDRAISQLISLIHLLDGPMC